MPCPNCQDPAFNALCIRCLSAQQGDIDPEYVCDREQCGHIALYSELQELKKVNEKPILELRGVKKVNETPILRALAILAGIITIGVIVVIYLNMLGLFLDLVFIVVIAIKWNRRRGPGGEGFTCPSCSQTQMRPGYGPRGEYLMRRASR